MAMSSYEILVAIIQDKPVILNKRCIKMGKLIAKIWVKDVIRKGISTVGNPSYWIDFRTHDSLLSGLNASIGYTASNAQCGYSATSFVGKDCVVEYHFTRKGTLIIDTMKEV